MNTSNPQAEPTMEEILASIRKIISEDSNDGESKAPAAADAPAENGDVLELTDEEVLDEPTIHRAPADTPRYAQAPVSSKPDDEIAFEETHVRPSVSTASNNADAESKEGFFSETTRKAMHETFAQLETKHEEAPRVTHVDTAAPDGASVQTVFEHAVRERFGPVVNEYLHGHIDQIVERMKPIIREWMDEHFPAILEGAVRNEVERAVRASGASKLPRR
jgi:cell pole-organizing protein PopZ